MISLKVTILLCILYIPPPTNEIIMPDTELPSLLLSYYYEWSHSEIILYINFMLDAFVAAVTKRLHEIWETCIFYQSFCDLYNE